MSRQKVAVAWSGGKDSAMAFFETKKDPRYEIVSLLTTVTGEYDRISMHGVRRELLRKQAEAVGLPLLETVIPPQCSNEIYEQKMAEACAQLKRQGVTSIVFGDLWLEDVRNYRISNLAKAGMTPLFPVWLRPVQSFAREIISAGIRTTLSCVDSQQISGSFAGREYDESLLKELPPSADPCGEKGEFHTFVWNGPFFSQPVEFTKGEVTVREGRFHYCDLIPVA